MAATSITAATQATSRHKPTGDPEFSPSEFSPPKFDDRRPGAGTWIAVCAALIAPFFFIVAAILAVVAYEQAGKARVLWHKGRDAEAAEYVVKAGRYRIAAVAIGLAPILTIIALVLIALITVAYLVLTSF